MPSVNFINCILICLFNSIFGFIFTCCTLQFVSATGHSLLVLFFSLVHCCVWCIHFSITHNWHLFVLIFFKRAKQQQTVCVSALIWNDSLSFFFTPYFIRTNTNCISAVIWLVSLLIECEMWSYFSQNCPSIPRNLCAIAMHKFINW